MPGGHGTGARAARTSGARSRAAATGGGSGGRPRRRRRGGGVGRGRGGRPRRRRRRRTWRRRGPGRGPGRDRASSRGLLAAATGSYAVGQRQLTGRSAPGRRDLGSCGADVADIEEPAVRLGPPVRSARGRAGDRGRGASGWAWCSFAVRVGRQAVLRRFAAELVLVPEDLLEVLCANISVVSFLRPVVGSGREIIALGGGRRERSTAVADAGWTNDDGVADAGGRPVSPWRARPACAPPPTARPGSGTRAPACPGCSTRRSARCAR